MADLKPETEATMPNTAANEQEHDGDDAAMPVDVETPAPDPQHEEEHNKEPEEAEGEEAEEEDVDDEEEDDVDEEEEEEEEEGRTKQKKRRVDDPARQFFDLEAEVDDDESDEAEFMNAEEAREAVEADKLAAQEAARGGSYRREMANKYVNDRDEMIKDAEARAKELDARHANYAAAAIVENEMLEVNEEDKLLAPTENDPKLWISGHEREVVAAILNKYARSLDDAAINGPLVTSVFCRDGQHGHIYIEAFKDAHVKALLQEFRNLFRSTRLVPMDQMTQTLKTKDKAHIVIKPNQYVLMKRAPYTGDIAQVVEYNEPRGLVVLRLLPRLNYELLREKTVGGKSKDDKKRLHPEAGGPRPNAAPLDLKKIEEYDIKKERTLLPDSTVMYLIDGQTFVGGYLHKQTSIKNIQYDKFVPDLEALQNFQSAALASKKDRDDDDEGEGDELAGKQQDVRDLINNVVGEFTNVKEPLKRGDRILVTKNALQGLEATVREVSEDKVKVTFHIDDASMQSQSLELSLEEVKKVFRSGDHVRVTNGQHLGETGIVISADERDIVTIMGDLSRAMFQVLSVQISMATEVAAGADTISKYSLHDLVEYGESNASMVAVIVHIEHETVTLLNQYGTLEQKPWRSLGRKVKRLYDHGMDRDYNVITADDEVEIVQGENSGTRGRILYVVKKCAFVLSNTYMQNSGIIFAKTHMLRLIGGERKKEQKDANALYGASGGYLALDKSKQMPNAGIGGGRSMFIAGIGRGAGKFGKEDEMVNKSVVITRGMYKGYMGRVTEKHENMYYVLLDAKPKTVNVPASDVRPTDRKPITMPSGAGVDGGDQAPRDLRRTPKRTPTRSPRTNINMWQSGRADDSEMMQEGALNEFILPKGMQQRGMPIATPTLGAIQTPAVPTPGIPPMLPLQTPYAFTPAATDMSKLPIPSTPSMFITNGVYDVSCSSSIELPSAASLALFPEVLVTYSKTDAVVVEVLPGGRVKIKVLATGEEPPADIVIQHPNMNHKNRRVMILTGDNLGKIASIQTLIQEQKDRPSTEAVVLIEDDQDVQIMSLKHLGLLREE